MFSKLLATLFALNLIFPPSSNALPMSPPRTSKGLSADLSWSGVAVLRPATGERFTSVSGEFTIPHLAHDPPPPEERHVAFFVGVDGSGHEPASLLNAGIFCTVDTHGAVGCYVFAHWFPEWIRLDHGPDPLEVVPGNHIEVVVQFALDDREGMVTIKNISKGTETTRRMQNATPVKGAQVEWMVSLPTFLNPDGSIYFSSGLADFGEVTFTHCYAKTDKGNTVDLSKPSLFYRIYSEGSKITDVNTSGGRAVSVSGGGVRGVQVSSLTVKYQGPGEGHINSH
ncbi:peptidase A4 family-domain-containing protein [Lentinula raphanica]|nr:peptidase A4 family-domain-containing protein [Lentinula raphanica]